MRHPRWCGDPADRPQRQWDTAEGAQKLAARIRAAWAAAGHDVPVVVLETNPGHPETLWCVRMPTLINGLPHRSANA